MLTQLHIKDLVIVESLELELGSGMTTLTGETGAGKSILIDALSLTLGEKADSSMIRAACPRAQVTAVFQLEPGSHADQWLIEQELDNEQECLLRRIINREGRSRAYINGSPVPLSSLKTLGEMLVDIHGQHAHQSLLKRPAQRVLLDAFAGHDNLVTGVATAYSNYQNSLQELEALQSQASERTSRIDYLRYQIQELDTAALDGDEIAGINDEHRRLAHADRLQSESAEILYLLVEADPAAQSMVSKAARGLEELALLDAGLKEILELLESAQVQIDEAVSQLRGYVDGIEVDPGRLQTLDERLAQLHELARKHQIEPQALPGLHADLIKELDRLEHADIELATLEKALATCQQDYQAAATLLSKSRHRAAKKLSRIVTERMQGLNMSDGLFQIELTTLADDRMSQSGSDQVDFLVAANPGQTPAALNRVASGGELSRISLALQVATANCGEVPTLIFDEVDVGIGGAVAEIVGQLLKDLGQARQVLCVTHLPQVASQGHQHLRVSKSSQKDRVQTEITTLDEAQRVQEVARMLGGLDITDQTLAHADEMISLAQARIK